MTRTLSARGAALIADFEGKVNTLYEDPAGHCTIGIGHLVHLGNCDGSEPAEFQRGLSDQEVYDLFIADAQRYIAAVNRLVTVPLTQNQFDALVSFTYNLGEWALTESWLLRKLNAGDYVGAASEFARWVRADGVILPGLVRRRAAEAELFVAAEEEFTVADLAHLHPVFRERVVATGVSVLSGARSTARQRQLYEDYLAGRGNPANPPGTSWHEFDEAAPWPNVGAAESAATSLVGGCWALAVDFKEPYPHDAPGLIFPILGEPWHGQPTEVPEKVRTAGAWRRLPLPHPAPVSPKEEDSLFIFDAPGHETGVWVTDGIVRRPTNDPQPYLDAGVKHLGTLTDGQFNELADAREIGARLLALARVGALDTAEGDRP